MNGKTVWLIARVSIPVVGQPPHPTLQKGDALVVFCLPLFRKEPALSLQKWDKEAVRQPYKSLPIDGGG
jgi:hypothetical protein